MKKIRNSKYCKHCGKEFFCPIRKNGTQYCISEREWEKRRFCSIKCALPENIEKSMKKRLGIPLSKEHKEKIHLALKGKKRPKFPKEWIGNLRKSHLGQIPWNTGKIGVMPIGKNHPRWITDRTKLQRYGDDNLDRRSSVYGDWRLQIYKRDNYKCKINNCDCKGRIFAHHILSYTEFPELRYEVNNGITLCLAHHPRKRAEEKQLSPFFMNLIETKV